MTLDPGTKLGSYEIGGKLGAGGMGEVYRARDTKLGREVAIKLILEEVSADPARLARFEREARVLASLNHPNVATLHGFFTATPLRATGSAPLAATSGDVSERGMQHELQHKLEREASFLVMELVEGETLADRIARGPIPASEAIPLFIQIAEGLEAAHEKGVIHRDLKPANIKITSRGAVKILDFGLAKAMLPEDSPASDAAISASPTLTMAATQRGQILGTAAYMSPEQARGKPVDKRADVWAFGVCLYEALTGQRPFRGEDAPATLAKVLERDVDLELLSGEVPPGLRQIVARCLRKDPERRTHDIADARVALEDVSESDSAPGPPVRLVRRSASAVAVPWLLAIGLAAITGTMLWRSRTGPERRDVALQHYEVELQRPMAFLTFALAPDGRYLSYTGVGKNGDWVLYLRPFDDLEAREIEGTSKGEYPFFSPDSRWLAFHAQGELRRVPVEGGKPTVICETPEATGGTWGQNGDVVFGSPDGLYRVPASGGAAVRITDAAGAGAIAHAWPSFLPDGDSVLFTHWTKNGEEAATAVLSLSSGRTKTLLQGSGATYAASGHLVVHRGGSLMAATFDPTSWSVSSDAVQMLPEVAAQHLGGSLHQVVDSGRLVYLETEAALLTSTLVAVDRNGIASPLHDEPGTGWGQPRLSPSGSRLAYIHGRRAEGAFRGALESHDLSSGRTVPVFRAGGGVYGTWPVWSPDEEWIAFVSNQAQGANTFRARADGRGEMEQLTFEPVLRTIPTSWSVDHVLAVEQGPNHRRDILMLSMEEGQKRDLRPFLVNEHNERGAKFSPDGKWIAFTSDRGAQDEVWVVGYPEAGAAKLVSIGGGREPVWSRDGRELFYRRGDEMWAVPVDVGPDFRVGEPKLLFRGEYSYGYLDWAFNYDVFPDASRFVMVKDGPSLELHVLVNWFSELERLVPSR